MELQVTDSAIDRIAELISKDSQPQEALRVSVDGGGCSGFMYDYKLVASSNEDDFILEKGGVKILVDPISQQFLDGCTLDFIRELGSSYFQITNPKATAKCGCGNSFSI
ncbi:MAG: iron-sulfur cluster assembly accessory protein [Rickettsiaceae bacterium]